MRCVLQRVLAVAVLLSACRGRDCLIRVVGGMQDALPFYTPGQPYEARIRTGNSEVCLTQRPTVEATVLDIDNEIVPSEVSIADDDPSVAVLRFTPTEAGPFHFAVRFQPNLSLVQGGIYRAFKSDRVKLAELPLMERVGRCYDLLSSGALLCQISSGVGIIEGGRVTHRTPGKVVSAGSVFWSQTATELERWADTDAGWAITHRLARHSWTPLAATPTELFAADGDGGAWRIDIDGGELVGTPLALPMPVLDQFGAMTPDAGAWWGGGCLNPVRADGGQQCFGGFWNENVEPAGMWSHVPGGPITFVGVDGVTSSHPDPGITDPDAPFLRFGLVPLTFELIASMHDGGLRLELLDEEFGSGAVTSDGTRLLFTDAASTQVTVYPR